MINPEMGPIEPEKEVTQQESIPENNTVDIEKLQQVTESAKQNDTDALIEARQVLEKLSTEEDAANETKTEKYSQEIRDLGDQFIELENNPDRTFLHIIKHVFTGKTFKYGTGNLEEGLLSERVGTETSNAAMKYVKEKRLEEAKKWREDHPGEKPSFFKMVTGKHKQK